MTKRFKQLEDTFNMTSLSDDNDTDSIEAPEEPSPDDLMLALSQAKD